MAEENKEGCGVGAVVISTGCVSGVILAIVISIVIVQFAPRFFKSQGSGNAAPSEADVKGVPRSEVSVDPASSTQVQGNIAEDEVKAPGVYQDSSESSETAANSAPAIVKPAAGDESQIKPIQKAVTDSEMTMHRRDFESAIKQAEKAIDMITKLETKAQGTLKQELSELKKRADFIMSYSREKLSAEASEETVPPPAE